MQAREQQRDSTTCRYRYHYTLRSCDRPLAHASLTMISDRRSNTPVPLLLGAPITMFAEGLRKSSKSPCRVASDRNAAVVSKEALSSGDDLVAIPVRLKGL